MANETKKKETAKKPVKKAAAKAAPKKTAAKKAPAKVVAKKSPVKKTVKAAPKKTVEKAPAKVVEKKTVVKAKAKVKVSGGNTPLAHGVGRRKASVARVWLRRGKGNVTVNKLSLDRYFDTDFSRQRVKTPFVVYPNTAHYDINVNVVGGGKKGQADAIKLGIARALVSINPEIRPLLRQHGLLTVDSRVVERKKYGQPGARRKFQFVKR